jgi:hypothetical protein
LIKFVYIDSKARKKLKRQLRESMLALEERCGRLIGVRYKNAIVIHEITYGFIDRSSTHCIPGHTDAQEKLVSLAREIPNISLVGDWHTHWFEDSPRPSRGDLESLKLIHERYEEYRASYVLLLVARKGVAAYIYTQDGLKTIPVVTIMKAVPFNELDTIVGSRHREFRKLVDKKVAIVGLGSGGSLLAYLLAESGVGEFRLVDYDVLAPDSASR